METIELKAETRTSKGNSPARALRRAGRVPAILYGPKSEPKMLSIAAYDLEMIVNRGGLGRSVLNLVIDDSQVTKPAMVKELQTHPLTRGFVHLDLYEIDMNRKIRVNVPVMTTGKAIGIEQSGGMLQIIRRELEVLCLPNAIPNSIIIDITNLDVGDAVHVNEIKTEGNIEISHDINFTVLTISSTKAETEGEAAEEAEEPEEAAEAGTEE